MKDQIVEKLNTYLSSDKEMDEPATIYFFAQARKIIEHLSEGLPREEQKAVYPFVKFYADWCFHTKKSRSMDDFRDCVESTAAALEEQMSMTLIESITTTPRHALASLVEQEYLRGELDTFLQNNNINNSLTQENRKWSFFRNSLGKILADQPLDFGTKPVGNLKIREIRFLPTNANIACAFLISIKNIDGRELGPFIFADDDASTSF